jgi:hypothetical protein
VAEAGWIFAEFRAAWGVLGARTMKVPAISLLLLLLLAACGGASVTNPSSDAGSDATGMTDAAGMSDAAGDVVTRPDGGAGCHSESPTYHRPSASACPSHETDAGPDSGIVGCMPPHDACLVDSDCGDSGVCDCEEPRCSHPFATTGNVCLPGNCRVDSDCACGFCAGATSCTGLGGYWCTTPLDECSTNGDCQDAGALTVCQWSTDRWACAQAAPCPP